MPPLLTLTDTDNNALSDLPDPVESGAAGGTLTVRLHNHRDNATGDPAAEVALIVETEDPDTPGTYLRSGLPPQDELWMRARVIGSGATDGGDVTWSAATTGWSLLGAYRRVLLGDIPPACYVEIELVSTAPGAAIAAAWRRRLVPLYEEYSSPLPLGFSPPAHGILTGVGDSASTAIVSGLAVTPSDTPDAYVHVARGLALIAGRLAGHVLSDHELDQDDSAAATLAADESYRVLITVGPDAVPTVTKGLLDVDPVDPTAPVGERRLARVTVRYQVGGTSVIEPDDVEDLRVLDRYAVEAPATGRTIEVHGGTAVGGGTYRYRGGRSPVTVDPSTTAWVWQLATGLFAVHDSATSPPESGAIGPLWAVTTDTDDVTELVDLRTYADASVVLRLTGDLPGSPGAITDLWVCNDGLMLERVAARFSDNGGGSSGETVLDLIRTPLGGSPATISPSSGDDDARPRLAFDATDLVDEASQHELCELRRGDVIALTSVTHPTGGTPTSVEVYLYCRRM